jgi:hypothetical protein
MAGGFLHSVRVMGVTAALCAAQVLSAAESDWQPQLEPPNDPAGRGPEEAFVIRLSSPYDAAAGRLALELDNVDVTQQVRPLDESYTAFEFVPYTPLSRGQHLLRMVEYRSDGSIVERGRWAFTVHVLEAAFDVGTNVAASYRLDDKPRGVAGRTQGQGSVQWNAYSDNGSRRYAATGDLLIDTNTSAGFGGAHRAVDLGDFLLSRGTRHTNLSAGHHAPGAMQGLGQRNLIFDGYSRRGLSGTVHTEDATTALTGFALRTESIRGFENGFGVGDADNRIAGAMLRVQPKSNVALGVGYVSGEGSEAGFATGAGSTPLEGEAGNVSLDTLWFEQRLSLRAEAAFSSVDLGQPFGKVTDQAYVAGLALQPHQGLKIGEGVIPWDLNLNYARIGSRFRSIANLQQVANIDEIRAGLNAYAGTVNFSLGGARTEDNVDSELYPSTRSDNVNVGLNWAPRVDADFGGWLFARPSLGINLLGDWRETVRQPEGSLAFPTDAETRGYTTFASFAHPYGAWTVTWGTTQVDDHTDAVPDFRYESAGISSSFQFGSRYSISPGLQFDVARDRDNELSQRTTNVSVSQNWMILVDRLYWTTSLGFNNSRISDDTSESQQFVANTTLSWQQGLFAFWLQGSYADTENEMLDFFSGMPSRFAQEQYQVFLGISMNWPGNNGTQAGGVQ